LCETHEICLLQPEALAVSCAPINTEERERVDQEGRKMAAHEEREGGSSSSARAGAQEPETLHGAREGTDTLRVLFIIRVKQDLKRVC
jgi:hypothetical protein